MSKIHKFRVNKWFIFCNESKNWSSKLSPTFAVLFLLPHVTQTFFITIVKPYGWNSIIEILFYQHKYLTEGFFVCPTFFSSVISAVPIFFLPMLRCTPPSNNSEFWMFSLKVMVSVSPEEKDRQVLKILLEKKGK